MKKVTIIGSGNWGSTVSKIIGENTKEFPDTFDEKVTMYVYDEMVDGESLVKIINTRHENVKYLPGITLPSNVVANPDLLDSVKDADILVFVQPHQFVPRTLATIKGKIKEGAIAITLIKGFIIKNNELILISDLIEKELGIECSTLMGANVARDVAMETFCETTVGSRSKESGELFFKLFNKQAYFRVTVVQDVKGVEISGSLKNIVAIGAGICDGLGYGTNTKAAIIRVGLGEIIKFGKKFYPTVKDATFFESCGIGDLITTCFGGRNRRCAEEFGKSRGKKEWADIEKELLGGQKLQGTLTAIEVHEFLDSKGLCDEFPLFEMIYRIVVKEKPVDYIIKY